jgi:hypothetical protein
MEKIRNNKIIESVEDIHAFLEKTLIEAYLKGKGYTLKNLKDLSEADSRRLKTEASTYASNKLAEVELRARLLRELHDAYVED